MRPLQIGDRVRINHPIHGCPIGVTYTIIGEDDCHYRVVPNHDNAFRSVRVRKSVVRHFDQEQNYRE